MSLDKSPFKSNQRQG